MSARLMRVLARWRRCPECNRLGYNPSLPRPGVPLPIDRLDWWCPECGQGELA